MKRIASQTTFCSPKKILRRTVVEQNAENMITRIFGLDEMQSESSHTMFFDGIISAEIISIKLSTTTKNQGELNRNYQYIELNNINCADKVTPSGKPLILDFGSISTAEINQKLPVLTSAFEAFSIFEIIAACTFYPAEFLEINAELIEHRQTQLILWQGLDLVNKKLTQHTSILAL